MDIVCDACGYAGENTWRDGNCYCGMCGTALHSDATGPNQQPIHALCPICKNDQGNYMEDGKCYCVLCGTEFDYLAPTLYDDIDPGKELNAPERSGWENHRKELEKKKSHHLKWGVFFLIFFWPISIYHFYKVHQISQEMN